jgi:hypothetical protein
MRNRLSCGYLGLAALVILALSAAPLSALTINPSSSGLHVARGCSSASCFGTQIYSLSGAPSVTGSFDIVGTTLSFSIDLVAATLTGNDGAVTAVDFTNVNYSGSFTVDVDSATEFSFLDQDATVAGTLTPVGAGSLVDFDIFPVNVTGNCSGTPGSSLACGLQFGAGVGFEIDVNGNPRFFNHTVNIFSVPEPGTALLLGLGLSGLAVNRRRSVRVAD